MPAATIQLVQLQVLPNAAAPQLAARPSGTCCWSLHSQAPSLLLLLLCASIRCCQQLRTPGHPPWRHRRQPARTGKYYQINTSQAGDMNCSSSSIALCCARLAHHCHCSCLQCTRRKGKAPDGMTCTCQAHTMLLSHTSSPQACHSKPVHTQHQPASAPDSTHLHAYSAPQPQPPPPHTHTHTHTCKPSLSAPAGRPSPAPCRGTGFRPCQRPLR